MCGKRYVVQDGAPGENGDRALASAPQNERGTGQCTERVAEQSQASPAAGSH
jgi:hypothetical protein